MIRYLYINSRDEFYRIDYEKIVYFESDSNYTTFVLCNKLRGTVLMNLHGVQSLLSERLREQATIFARIGKRHIVNLNYVFHIAIAGQRLTLSDGATFAYTLAISKEALKMLRELYITTATKRE